MDDSVFKDSPFGAEKKTSSNSKKIVLIIVVLLLLAGLGFGGYTFYQAKTVVISPTPTPTQAVFPTDSPTPELSPTKGEVAPSPTKAQTTTNSVDKATGLDRAKLSISIQNGSGVAGAANSASELLKNLGYKVSAVSNADNFSYEDVTILVSSSKATYLPLLKKDLGSSYTLGSTSATLSGSTNDAVVIIGK